MLKATKMCTVSGDILHDNDFMYVYVNKYEYKNNINNAKFAPILYIFSHQKINYSLRHI